MSWQNMVNPRSYVIKKFMFEFLKGKFQEHEKIIDRIIISINTDDDMQDFSKMMIDLYETAYMRAVDDHRDQLAKMGLNVKVVPSDHSKNG